MTQTPSNTDDRELIEAFLAEGRETLDGIHQALRQWQQSPQSLEPVAQLQRAFHLLKGSARLAGWGEISDLCQACKPLVQAVENGDIPVAEALTMLVAGMNQLEQQLHQIKMGELLTPVQGVITDIHGLLTRSGLTAWQVDTEFTQAVTFVTPHHEDSIRQQVELKRTFLQEGRAILDSIAQHLQQCEALPMRSSIAQSLQREFHILKGSSKLAGWDEISQLSDAAKNLLAVINERHLAVKEQVQQLMQQTIDDLSAMFALVKVDEVPKPATEQIAQLKALTRQLAQANADTEEDNALPLASSPASSKSNHDEADEVVEADIDPDLLEVFFEEAGEIVAACQTALEQWRQAPEDNRLVSALQRHLHTLKGGARMAGLTVLGDLSHRIESLLTTMVEGSGLSRSVALFDLLQRCQDQIAGLLDQAKAGQPMQMDRALAADLQRLLSGGTAISSHLEAQPEAEAVSSLPVVAEPESTVPVAPVAEEIDPDLLAVFLEESDSIMAATEHSFLEWKAQPSRLEPVNALQRHLHTLKGGARMSGFTAIGDLSHVLESLFIAIVEERRLSASEGMFTLLQRCQDHLASMLDQAKAGKQPQPDTALLQEVEQLLAGGGIAASSSTVAPSMPVKPVAASSAEEGLEPVDSELLAVFLEEAQDILNSSEKVLQRWPADPNNPRLIEELQRYLHTLKGGARMSNLTVMGDLSHLLESALIAVSEGQSTVSPSLINLMQRAYDQLVLLVEQARQQQPATAAPAALLTELQRLLAVTEAGAAPIEAPVVTVVPLTTVAPEAQPAAAPLPKPASSAPSKPAAPPVTKPAGGKPVAREEPAKAEAAATPAAAAKAAPPTQELIRVQAEVLDQLVNNAGEISIYRSRLEQQVTEFRFNFSEMAQTVARLRQQLRNLEIETEAQVISRHVQEGADTRHADFDPLEMDRYSTLQQLSRSLTETVSDLISIQGQLENVARDSEILLLQQARVTTNLQEGLMGTRMVPFANQEARMRRIIRQTCQTLQKKADMRLEGADIELDRTMLDRIMAPLEHMLRNAIAHGIEEPQQRLAKGKPETGTITISLVREGTEMVIRFKDDGAGINVEAVRKKAIDRGLMKQGSPLPDREIMQFILETGFSTADKVSQVSGRGVGMDVVNSEIKQLNGILEIDSKKDCGSIFTIRLPSTLSVNQALIVQLGEELYAVPLDSVEGVVRLGRDELQQWMAKDQPYHYVGEAYDVRYLAGLLGGVEVDATALAEKLPVILVRTAEHRAAIYVDAILGSREVVIKPVGAQISRVHGLAGATILADGRVIFILDIVALIRSEIAQRVAKPVAEAVVEAVAAPSRLRVMVVDDSLTVRKVTTRLLERHDMEVTTAKDGVEALTLLQDYMPDVMLLDVEMPRMDGFELATHIRNDDRLRALPIIMITSRQGQKHRTRAEKIGVNRYLGKPYQESDLLENIHTVVHERMAHV